MGECLSIANSGRIGAEKVMRRHGSRQIAATIAERRGESSRDRKSGRRAQDVRRRNVPDFRRAASELADADGVIVIDIDRFQDINLAYGREAGDRLLDGMAGRIASIAGRDGWHRTGDDEFMVFYRRRHGDLIELVESLRLSLGEPFELDGSPVCASVSIGAALRRPGEACDVDRLIHDASVALRQAKKTGRNRWRLYEPGMPYARKERLELEYELRQAIRRNQLELYYQPRLELATERVICLEALVRWNHPTRGLIMPQEFIPIAEESGLILELDEWVLRRACEQKRVWSEHGILPVRVSVNVSPLQFRDAGFADRVLEILRETGTDPRALELEITETSVMEDADRALEMITALSGCGCTISIDDFGIGHSSLNRLKLLPVKCLKIDRTFVRNMTIDKHDLAITNAIINLGLSLDLQVVAEGVEDVVQLELLKQASCTTIQGFLLSPPVRAVELERLVREEKLVC
jgi:diguanylate cyclase (GGDEF)-like protein